jgi:hypothetical protein
MLTHFCCLSRASAAIYSNTTNGDDAAQNEFVNRSAELRIKDTENERGVVVVRVVEQWKSVARDAEILMTTLVPNPVIYFPLP